MQLLNELQNKIADSDQYIKVIGNNALEIQENEINNTTFWSSLILPSKS